MDVTDSFLSCLCGAARHRNVDEHYGNSFKYTLINEKPGLEPVPSMAASPYIHTACRYQDEDDSENDGGDLHRRADRILNVLFTTPKPADSSEVDLTNQVAAAAGLHAQSWLSHLAELVLHGLEWKLRDALSEYCETNMSSIGGALGDAFHHAVELAKEEFRELWEYVKAHPHETAAMVLLTLVSLGVLARLVPFIVRWLGFGRLGPTAGKLFFFSSPSLAAFSSFLLLFLSLCITVLIFPVMAQY